MQSASLSGRSILIVEDEPLILRDISTAFEKAGAVVMTARSIAEAARRIEHDGFTACRRDVAIPEPANPETLLDAIVRLLKRHNDENPPALRQGDDVRA